MNRKRKPENKGLPTGWRLLHNAYYYKVPGGLEYLWEGKQLYRLGKTLPDAYRVWSDRILAGEKARTIGQLLDRYMAEVVQERPGQYLLIEHHCPICDAARECTGLCRAELEVFRAALGGGADVERTTHMLSDGDRCVYRIRAR